MSKQRIVSWFSLAVALFGITTLVIVFATRTAHSDYKSKPKPTQLSTAEKYAQFVKTFKAPLDPNNTRLGPARKLLSEFLRKTQPGARRNDAIGCDKDFCGLKLTFSNLDEMQKFFHDNAGPLKAFHDWEGEKFIITLEQKDVPRVATAGGSNPDPKPLQTMLALGDGDGGSCKWSLLEAGNTRRSYQMSPASCSGYLQAALPSTLGSGSFQAVSFLEALGAQAFLPVPIPPATQKFAMTGGSGSAGVLVCPIPFETGKPDTDHTDTPVKICATVGLITSQTGSNVPPCRIRWVASTADGMSTMRIERLSASQRATGGSGLRVTAPIVEAIQDPALLSLFNIALDTEMSELSSFEVMCSGMQPLDTLMRYRVDYEVKSVLESS